MATPGRDRARRYPLSFDLKSKGPSKLVLGCSNPKLHPTLRNQDWANGVPPPDDHRVFVLLGHAESRSLARRSTLRLPQDCQGPGFVMRPVESRATELWNGYIRVVGRVGTRFTFWAPQSPCLVTPTGSSRRSPSNSRWKPAHSGNGGRSCGGARAVRVARNGAGGTVWLVQKKSSETGLRAAWPCCRFLCLNARGGRTMIITNAVSKLWDPMRSPGSGRVVIVS